MWAFNVTTQRPEDADVSLGTDAAQLAGLAAGPNEAASVEQVEAVARAVESIVNAGVLGPAGATFNVTVSGHANPDHSPHGIGGGLLQPDFVSISIAQVGYPAPDGRPGGVVTEPIETTARADRRAGPADRRVSTTNTPPTATGERRTSGEKDRRGSDWDAARQAAAPLAPPLAPPAEAPPVPAPVLPPLEPATVDPAPGVTTTPAVPPAPEVS